MPDSKVWVVQSLLAGDTLRRVEVEQLREQINGQWVCTGEESGEGNSGLDWEGADVILGLHIIVSGDFGILKRATYTGRTDTTEGILRWRTEVVKDLVQLVDITARRLTGDQKSRKADSLSALEDRLSSKQLCQDTSD